jgi:hypothetical protein
MGMAEPGSCHLSRRWELTSPFRRTLARTIGTMAVTVFRPRIGPRSGTLASMPTGRSTARPPPNCSNESDSGYCGISTLAQVVTEFYRNTLLEQSFVSGVHEALVILHGEAVPPFEEGYEGTPFHDFVGRLQGWSWPSG